MFIVGPSRTETFTKRTLIHEFHIIVTCHDAIFEFSFQLFGNIKNHGQYLTSDCSLTIISMVLRGRRRPGGAVLSGSPQVPFAMAECIPYSYRVHRDTVCQAGSCSSMQPRGSSAGSLHSTDTTTRPPKHTSKWHLHTTSPQMFQRQRMLQ